MAESLLQMCKMISRELLKVVEIDTSTFGYVMLRLDAEKHVEGLIPGMFYELRAASQEGKLFKPISIFEAKGSILSFLIKTVGIGTQAFAQLQVGDEVEALGPLGNGFPSIKDRRVLLVSGGAGYPPLAWVKQRSSSAKSCLHLHGCASANEVFACDVTATANGEVGHKGLVTDLVESLIIAHDIDLIFSCGPIPMLAKLDEICKTIEHYASMEAYMACGVGVCHGCAIPVGKGYKLVCKDGPVFDARSINWSEL